MNETVASVFDESEWDKVLMSTTTAVGTEKQNIKFLKKLVAVGISNIVYLRADLPEEAFAKRKLGSMELRVLQKTKGEEHKNDATNVLIEMVKDGMAAIDKGYLRKLSLVIFEGDEDAEEGDMRKAYETYSFYFGPQDKDFSLGRSSKHQGDMPMGEPGNNMPSELTEDKIVKATKKLLRRLIAGTQELDVLPEVANLTICLEYYDEITPKDYQPKGYEHSDYTPQVNMNDEAGDNGEKEAHFLGMGQIDIKHQKMALRLKSKARVLSEEDELHPASLEKRSSQDINEGLENARTAVSAISLEPANGENEDMEIEAAQMSDKEQRKMKMKLKRKQLEEEHLLEMELDNKKYSKYSNATPRRI